jgi:hypothetical protein
MLEPETSLRAIPVLPHLRDQIIILPEFSPNFMFILKEQPFFFLMKDQ